MTTISHFDAMIPFGKPLTLYHLLDQALAERGATLDSDDDFRLASYDRMRLIVDRIYWKLSLIAGRFLVDPEEVTLPRIRAKNIRCYDIAELAEAGGHDFLVPVAPGWRDPPDLVVRHFDWPISSETRTARTFPRPHLLPRLYGEYFRQAARIMASLRYYAPDALQSSITIPTCAAGNSISHIYCIFIDQPLWEDATVFRIEKVWSQYLAPGRYYCDSFGKEHTESFPNILFAGYVDLQNNLQFFTS